MADVRIRRQIALLAARLMYERLESEYFTAKRKAARQLGLDDRHHPRDLPSNAEIREQIQGLADLHEGEARQENLRDMRITAVTLMRALAVFRPKLIGSTLTGHVRRGSDIDIHVFSDSVSAVTSALDDLGHAHTVERKLVRKHGEERVFTHIHLAGHFNVELTLYDMSKVNHVFKSSITGGPIDRATLPELLQLMAREYPDLDLSEDALAYEGEAEETDRYAEFRAMLLRLEQVKQNPRWHPEGDALYHSLQVFELARDAMPYDEEFLLAALLHDVGKAIDPDDHVGSGLEALEGMITERTAFLIAHHMEAHDLAEGTLGHRAKVRLQASEHFEDLMLMQECDRKGRRPGAQVCSVDAALDAIRKIEELCGDD